ncbi:hypothetical protein [Streptomyces sp. 8L]|uniref:hypothetical protein n=1 Tax=unclassified Streptomyces TaxID=2593676 RepID=UPI001CD3585F|nr:hypothetical protein [Streptomyces sp. 8L]MCA1219766.1 hypothetical protein [Streptomyces sp. 8L]
MSESTKDEEVTTLDSHIPAPPEDAAGENAKDAATGPETEAATGDDTPIKPLDSHIP